MKISMQLKTNIIQFDLIMSVISQSQSIMAFFHRILNNNIKAQTQPIDNGQR